MATKSSNVDIRLKVRGGRSSAAQLMAVRREAEQLGIRGAAAMGRFAAQSKKLKDTGRTLTRNVTFPLLAGGAAAFKMSADFDDSMNKIVALVGVGRGQVNAWKEDILGLSKATGRAPQELADAMFFITSAGFRGKTAMAALAASARAADAGLGDTKTVADAVTSAMNAYGPKVLSAGKATDIMTAAVREGKMEASALAPVIGSVLPMADAAGVGFEQVAGAMALMSKSGTDAARGATQMTAILGTFAKPTTKMVEGLDKMGLSLGGARKMLAKDGLVKTLDTLRRGARKAGVDLSDIFGNKRAITGVLQLTKNLKETGSVMGGVAKSHGDADKAFEEAQKSAKDQLDDLVTSAKVAGIELGAAIGPTVVPILTSLSEALGNAGDSFSKLSPTVRKSIVWVVLFAVALGPLMWVLGNVAGGVGKFLKALVWLRRQQDLTTRSTKLIRVQLAALWVWQKICAAGTKLMAGAQWLLNIALRANPIGLIITALMALGLGLVLAYKKVGWFRKIVDATFGFVKKHWKWLLIPVAPIVAPILLIVSNFRRIKSVASSVFSWVKTAAGDFIGFFRKLPGRMASAAKGLFNGIKDAFRSAINWIITRWNNFELTLDLPGILGKVGLPDKVTIGTPDLPMLAQGGWMTGFGSAVVGDAGPEVLNITPRGVAVQPLGAAPSNALAGGGAVHEHRWYIDGREITNQVGHHVRVRQATA